MGRGGKCGGEEDVHEENRLAENGDLEKKGGLEKKTSSLLSCLTEREEKQTIVSKGMFSLLKELSLQLNFSSDTLVTLCP